MRAGVMAAILWAALPQSGATVPEIGFHHLHLTDARPEARIEFYERLFDPAITRRIALGDARGLQTGTRRILVSLATPGERRPAGLWHFGWGEVSLRETYLAHARREVAWEPPLPPEALHLHLRSGSPAAAAAWYRDVLGATVTLPAHESSRDAVLPPEHRMPGALVMLAGVPLLIYPSDRALASSLGSAIDHVAFVCADLNQMLAHLVSRRVTILREPYAVGEARALMAQGPDLVALEFLELPR